MLEACSDEKCPAATLNGGVPRPQGRPELAAWPVVRDYIVRVFGADPSRPLKALAHEAREAAMKSFVDDDIPSETTILRRMKEILHN